MKRALFTVPFCLAVYLVQAQVPCDCLQDDSRVSIAWSGFGTLFPNNSTTEEVRFEIRLDQDTPVGETFSSTITVWDSKGYPGTVSLALTRRPLEWVYEFSHDNATVSTTAPTQGTGTLSFDSLGQLEILDGIPIGPGFFGERVIGFSGLGTWAEDLALRWDLTEFSCTETPPGYITLHQGPSTLDATWQDGVLDLPALEPSTSFTPSGYLDRDAVPGTMVSLLKPFVDEGGCGHEILTLFTRSDVADQWFLDFSVDEPGINLSAVLFPLPWTLDFDPDSNRLEAVNGVPLN